MTSAAIPQTIITRQMVFNELVKAGINKAIADDLAYRYYKNELTVKDLELIKMELKSDIKSVHTELDNRIDLVKIELDNKIDNKFNELDNKIDNKFNELDNKIDNKFNELDNKIDSVKSELKSDIMSVQKDISNLEKNNKWIFGLTFALWLTVLGGFIALILK
ncbi:Bdr family repetitive protein (plasmid) [Borrelia miyamotoi]|uniref:Bdr family repetitive protein n=4 Tax=Borrelia miyamotoi TaxID=47466 RepID=A0AAQ3HEJ5_9SPIR|nr:Bdr family repetitive protein [Borrelia miyamotoi]AHH05796.1 BDR-repeat family protein [Borrelia miyamotoi FR64b]WAZ71326.1 Bdr family repetitive protein [Borrelia miyamotoi]WCB91213.1 Bdr family repetitive protein [Borrelia miyamotoi]WCL22210.1 Bdr family repetitive protein [Borrelia miyamotoi]WDE70413.1 Bdr family repetitive protein [Borrelia miyamotoi]